MKTQDIINMGLAWKQVTEAHDGDMPSKAHIMKMCKDGASDAEIKKMHPDCDQDKLQAMIDDCKGSMDEQVTEKMSSKEKMAKGLYNGKMDPVGQADADIDNDGDVDKSDKYLHNRRKAIKKNMKEGDAQSADKKPQMYIDPASGKKKVRMVPTDDKIVDKDANEGVVSKVKSFFKKPEPKPKPDPMKTASDIVFNKMSKMKLKDNRPKESVEENQKAALAKKLAKSAAASDKGKAAVSLPKAPFEIPKKESVEANQELEMVTEYSQPNSVSRMRNAMQQMWQEAADRKAHYKGAADPEGMNDKSKSSKGATDMLKTADDADTVDELPKAFNDVSNAGRAGPKGKARSNDNMKGDKAVVNPVKK